MIEKIEVEPGYTLDEYGAHAQLAAAVQGLRSEAAVLAPRLEGRTVWMVNSTSKGGGVAEMMPKLVGLLRNVGVPTEWVVMHTHESDFFPLTKRLHNLIHGSGDPHLTSDDRHLYSRVSREAASAFRPHLAPDDLLVIHDPQPAGMGALLHEDLGLHALWRCHIGLDVRTLETDVAWEFLRPSLEMYDHSVFSAPEYIPDYLGGHASIIHPALDPLSPKNAPMKPFDVVEVLIRSGLATTRHPALEAPFSEQALRLGPDGSFGPATSPEDIGLLYRPIVSQISRWDRLKGFAQLLEGFVRLKQLAADPQLPEMVRRHVELARLVMAGPEPAAVQDDPEAQDVLRELSHHYQRLSPALQRDVVLLSLPMGSRERNAVMVNALQRCSTVVAQNSIQEGFGLTVTEAMWKRAAVLGSSACGIRQQMRDGVDGLMVRDASDPDQIKMGLLQLLGDARVRERYGRAAEHRVMDDFLVFTQVRRWLEVLTDIVTGVRSVPPPASVR